MITSLETDSDVVAATIAAHNLAMSAADSTHAARDKTYMEAFAKAYEAIRSAQGHQRGHLE